MGKSGFYGISGAGNGLMADRPVRLQKNSGRRFLLQTYVKKCFIIPPDGSDLPIRSYSAPRMSASGERFFFAPDEYINLEIKSVLVL